MKGTTIGRRSPGYNVFLANPVGKQAPFFSSFSSPFSTSSGRGRGGGSLSDSTFFDFTPKVLSGNPTPDESKPPESSTSIGNGNGNGHGHGHGHGRGSGRGKPIHSDPVFPAFTSFISSIKPAQPASGHGRGYYPKSTPSPQVTKSAAVPPKIQLSPQAEQSVLPEGLSMMASAGRGNMTMVTRPQTSQENRHIRTRPKPPEPTQPKMRGEAMTALGAAKEGEGRGRGRGRGRGQPRKGRESSPQLWMKTMDQTKTTDEKDRVGNGEDLKPWEMKMADGDTAEAEKFAQRVGPDVMSALEEGFEEMSGRVLPSVIDDEYVEALHTNCMIEFEPEYLMGEFHQNPDIDEKPPIPLQDFLEKIKPFMMAYEGIQSQEEWEEAVKETLENVPLLKEIVDNYSGPDRITAKKQQEELERVANIIPASAPASMRRFTDRAVLSLQSNPGWKYNRKFQFMDKLVREVSQYK